MMDSEGIIWLASFPKSGNTWVRVFIDAYHHDREPDINSLFGVFTDQAERWYQACSPDPVSTMEQWQVALLRPAAMLNLRNSLYTTPKLVKTHNANVNVSGCPLIPPELTRRVVYLVRDPRDIVMSYARHFGFSLDQAIDAMTEDRVTLFDAHNRDGKVAHWTTSWARHVKSYAEAKDLDVTVVKYEQLKADPVRYFSWILEWIGVTPDRARVERAVRHCELSRLRAQESAHGFVEASHKAQQFFGKGETGGWRNALSADQVARLEAHAGQVMSSIGYDVRAMEAA